MFKTFFVTMYISKRRCFAQAAPNITFNEIKTHLHRSVLDMVEAVVDVVVEVADLVDDVVEVAECSSDDDCSSTVTSWAEDAWEDIEEFFEWIWDEIESLFE